VDERERRRLLGQWGPRENTPGGRREREVLERDLEGAPFRGRRVRLRPQPLGPSPEAYVASLGGPLPYMVRLREIEAETARHEAKLRAAWLELAEECAGDDAAFARRWRRAAERQRFDALNELIERHNRFYPAESRLPMDPRRRDFALVNGEHYRRRPLDASWVLDRFPPSLSSYSGVT
jgi:hypothetical protein